MHHMIPMQNEGFESFMVKCRKKQIFYFTIKLNITPLYED